MINNRFLNGLNGMLRQHTWFRLSFILGTGVAIPTAISYFVNLATSNDKNGPFIAAIVILCVIQGVLILMKFLEELWSPLQLIGEAVAVEEELINRKTELKRRCAAYEVVRDGLIEMNAQVCRMDRQYTECGQGFGEGLRNILEPVFLEAQLVLGVKHSHYGLQVYFGNYEVTPGVKDNFYLIQDKYNLALTMSNQFDSAVVSSLNELDPSQYAMQYNPKSRLVSELPEVFGTDCARLYFRRFAWQHIYSICAAPKQERLRIGVIVLTSMQTEPFAEDVLETLDFLSVAISKYVWTYEKCLEHSAEIVNAADETSTPAALPPNESEHIA